MPTQYSGDEGEGISQRFRHLAARFPDKIAVIAKEGRMTYRELNTASQSLAALLQSRGIRCGDRLGVVLPGGLHFVQVMLASAHLGAAIVPINPTMATPAVTALFQAVNVHSAIVASPYLDRLNAWQPGGFILEASTQKKAEWEYDLRNPVLPAPSPLSLPWILTATSGSTGHPKVIILTQQNKLDRAMSTASLYKLMNNDIFLAATPLYHSLAQRLVLLPLLLGGTSVIETAFSPQKWLDTVSACRVSFTIAVSSQLIQLIPMLSSDTDERLASLRCLVSSSALLPTMAKLRLTQALPVELHEIYGTSEVAALTDICFNSLSDKIGSVGRPVHGVQIRIVDSNGQPVPMCTVGEIECQTPLLCGGYDGNPDGWTAAMRDGWFRTLDMGYMDQDGYLYFMGRLKEIIITGGINVYPEDVEAVLRDFPAISEVAAYCVPDHRLGEIVAVAIVLRYPVENAPRRVMQFCLGRLADYQMPRKVLIMDELPRNAMGKVMRRRLTEIWENQ